MSIIRQALQMTVNSYPAAPKLMALTAPVASKQVAVYSAAAINGSGGAANLALLRKLNYTKRKMYRDASGTVTDQTDTLDAGTAVAFLTSLNDSFYAGSKDPFGFVGYNVSTAIGAGSTITYAYYNGTSFVTLNTFEANGFATGTKYIIFAPPVDWAAGGVTGADTTLYYIRVKATVAPATPVSFNSFWAAEMLAWAEAVADNSALQIDSIGEHKPLILDQGEGLMPYFSVLANLNLFKASYNINS